MRTLVSWCLGKGSWRQGGHVSIYSELRAPWEARAFPLHFVDESHSQQMSECNGSPQILPLPMPPGLDSKFWEKSYGKFDHKFRSVKTFNNGLTSCPKRPLFKTPTRRPICSVHSPLLLCIHGCAHPQSWLYSHWDVPFALPHIKNVRIIFPGNNIINMVGLSNISSTINPADVC